eukprot:TRINITY_DN53262_c0_g1_i1.p1 TRINITY_DN53262_c0_g1~~TRINITY_DN53262_c0_g1_i1.p1  ORF type:complete len:101 (-),score=29.15 TRINITY_DN53262_c0_g1_i1:169-471(-)
MGDIDTRPSKKQKLLPVEQKVSFMDLPYEAMSYLQSMFIKRKRSRSESEESPNVGKHTRVDPEPLASPPRIHNHKPARVDTDNMSAYQYMVYMNQRNSLD